MIKLLVGTLVWLVMSALAQLGSKYLWKGQPYLTVFFIFLTLLIGIAVILYNRKYYQCFPAKMQKIHLESLSFTFFSSIVVGLTYSHLNQKNFISTQVEIPFLVGYMGIVYLLSILINSYRYKKGKEKT